MCVPEPRLTYHHYIIGDVEHEAIIYTPIFHMIAVFLKKNRTAIFFDPILRGK